MVVKLHGKEENYIFNKVDTAFINSQKREDTINKLQLFGFGYETSKDFLTIHYSHWENEILKLPDIFLQVQRYVGDFSALKYTVKELILNEHMRVLSDYSFTSQGLTRIELNEGLIHIGCFALAGNKLNELIIPKTVKTIGYNGLKECMTGNARVTVKTVRISFEKLFSYIDGVGSCETLELILPYHLERNVRKKKNLIDNLGWRLHIKYE